MELDRTQHKNALGFSFLVVEIHQSLLLRTASFCTLDRLPAYVYGNLKGEDDEHCRGLKKKAVCLLTYGLLYLSWNTISACKVIQLIIS